MITNKNISEHECLYSDHYCYPIPFIDQYFPLYTAQYSEDIVNEWFWYILYKCSPKIQNY